jgi:hypothetical protein
MLDYYKDRPAAGYNRSQGKQIRLCAVLTLLSAGVQEESNNLLRRPHMGKAKDKGKKEVKKPKKGK